MNLIKIIPALFSNHYDDLTVKQFKEEFKIGSIPIGLSVVNDGKFDTAYEEAAKHIERIGIIGGKVILISGLDHGSIVNEESFLGQMNDLSIDKNVIELTCNKIEPLITSVELQHPALMRDKKQQDKYRQRQHRRK